MCAAEAAVTAVVTGQGEETFAEIVKCLVNGSSLGGVQGCAFSHEGEVMVNLSPSDARYQPISPP